MIIVMENVFYTNIFRIKNGCIVMHTMEHYLNNECSTFLQ